MPDPSEPASDPPEPAERSRRGVNGGEAVLGDGQKVELADLGERIAGRFLDPVVVFFFVLGALVIAAGDYVFVRACFVNSYCEPSSLDDPAIRGLVETTNFIVSLVVFGIIVLYEAAAIGVSGQTWGKRRSQVRVVTCRDDAVSSAERALVRALVPAAAGVGGVVAATQADFRVPALGGLVLWLVVYVSALWGRSGRGWHDMAAGTVVVRASSPDQQRTPTRHQQPQPTSWGMVSDYYGPRRSQGTEEHTSGTGP